MNAFGWIGPSQGEPCADIVRELGHVFATIERHEREARLVVWSVSGVVGSDGAIDQNSLTWGEHGRP